jgi:hypothetical protein
MAWHSTALAVASLVGITAIGSVSSGVAWSDGYARVGSADLSSDFSTISVCDYNAGDGLVVGVKYATNNLFSGVKQLRAPQGGCADDDIFFGSITNARFCYGVGFGQFPASCNPSFRR